MLMVPLAAYEWPERADRAQLKTLFSAVEWADGIFERIEATPLEAHLRWPRRIARIVVGELGGDDGSVEYEGLSVLNIGLGQAQGSVSQGTSPEDEEPPFEVGLWASEAMGMGVGMGMDGLKIIPDYIPEVSVSMA
jgi:hypothetical protein